MNFNFLRTAVAVMTAFQMLVVNCQFTNTSSKLSISDAPKHFLKEDLIPETKCLLDVISMAENVRNSEMNAENVNLLANASTQQAALIRQILILDSLQHASENSSREVANFQATLQTSRKVSALQLCLLS